MDCSIIIPHFDQVDHLHHCLLAIKNQTTSFTHEVIIVDVKGIGEEALGGSDYGLTIRWITTDIMNPYSSRNIGINSALSNNIILLDAKCKPDVHYLEAVKKNLIRFEGILAGSYKVEPMSSNNKDQMYGVFYLHNEKNVRLGFGVTAGNLAFKKELCEKIGLFDTTYHSGQDIEWSKRALSQGWDIHYISEMSVRYPGKTWKELKASVIKYFCGIYHQHKRERKSTWFKITYGLRYLLPMRHSTFDYAIKARSALSKRSDKKHLWLRAWWLKILMSRAYFSCMLKT